MFVHFADCHSQSDLFYDRRQEKVQGQEKGILRELKERIPVRIRRAADIQRCVQYLFVSLPAFLQ